MYRTHRPLIVFAVAAALAVVSTFHRAYEAVKFAVCGWIERTLPAPVRAGTAEHRPAVALVAAKNFVLRFIRRETPRIESRWRMCPSS